MDADAHRARLASFVVRARRVLASPLAQDDEQLAKAHSFTTMVIREKGDTRVDGFRRWMPSEEALETLLARARPLLLERDPVRYSNALASLSFLIRGTAGSDAFTQNEIRPLRKRWDGITQSSRYMVQVAAAAEVENPDKRHSYRDVDIADAFLYGDLVHADAAKQEYIEPIGLEDRFIAAFGLAADVVELTWVTLGIVWLCRRHLSLPESAWHSRVSVAGDQWQEKRDGQVFVAEVGTEIPDGPLGDQGGWTPFAQAVGTLFPVPEAGDLPASYKTDLH